LKNGTEKRRPNTTVVERETDSVMAYGESESELAIRRERNWPVLSGNRGLHTFVWVWVRERSAGEHRDELAGCDRSDALACCAEQTLDLPYGDSYAAGDLCLAQAVAE
jgi:hypothetical protein